MHQHIITYCPTYLLLKPYINAGKVLKTFWELISYHLYNNESGRNYCFSYNTGKKMEALHVSSFFKVSADSKWLEPSGWNPGSPTPEPVRGHLGAAFSSSRLTLPPLLSSLSVVTAWASQPAHLPLGLCPPRVPPGKEVSLSQAKANSPLWFRNYPPSLQRHTIVKLYRIDYVLL